MNPSMRSLRARLGAFRQQSLHNTRDTMAAARAAFLSKFEREVDPDGVLPEAERQRRAEAAKKFHFTKLAYESARKRAKAK